jgi:hypothetical protein
MMVKSQRRYLWRIALSAILSFIFVQNSYAWTHEVSVGFGYGKELDRNYTNMGLIADYVFMNKQIDPKLHFLMDTSMAWWHAGTTNNKNLYAFAISAGFRAYFVNPNTYNYRPFIQVAIGPSYLSSKTFGTKTQGMKFIFQDRFGGGIEIGHQTKAIVISLQFIHYSNADLKKPNPGFNIPFVGSIGYEI